MVEVPWQIIVGFIGLFAISLILQHFRKVDCQQIVEAEKRVQHQTTMRVYRDGYVNGWNHGHEDRKTLTGDDSDHA